MKKILLITIILIGVVSVVLFFNNNAGTESTNVSKKYVPNVTVKDLDGKDVEVKTLVNGKLTLFLFWATWCPSCRQELAELEKYYPKYKDKGLSIIAFSVDENVAEVIKFNKENNLLIKIMMSNSDLSSAYGGIKAVPTTFFLDNEGQIKNRNIGYNPKIEDEIKKYLEIK
ncbi:MAG: TlpA disulfide reductase family protein [bacterium]|nr:TlpA disulfide reductase family protein [bacterium]